MPSIKKNVKTQKQGPGLPRRQEQKPSLWERRKWARNIVLATKAVKANSQVLLRTLQNASEDLSRLRAIVGCLMASAEHCSLDCMKHLLPQMWLAAELAGGRLEDEVPQLVLRALLRKVAEGRRQVPDSVGPVVDYLLSIGGSLVPGHFPDRPDYDHHRYIEARLSIDIACGGSYRYDVTRSDHLLLVLLRKWSTEDEEPPLLVAIRHGNVVAAEAFLRAGADVNPRLTSKRRWCPTTLMSWAFACFQPSYVRSDTNCGMVGLLLSYGADPMLAWSGVRMFDAAKGTADPEVWEPFHWERVKKALLDFDLKAILKDYGKADRVYTQLNVCMV